MQQGSKEDGIGLAALIRLDYPTDLTACASDFGRGWGRIPAAAVARMAA